MITRSARRTWAAALLTASAMLTAGLASPATAATSSGASKGVVTLDGRPVVAAKVQIYRLLYQETNQELEVADTPLKSDYTDSRGRYSFAGLSAKSATSNRYVVLVTDRTGRIVKTFRTIVAKKGKTVTKNIHARAAASLTGTLATSDGRSPAGLRVGPDYGLYNDQGPSYDKLYPDWDTVVKADGTFSLRGIPADNYSGVVVSDGRYGSQCYDFTRVALVDCATGTDSAAYAPQGISLTAGEQRTLPAVTMTKFGPASTKLAGTVTDASGKPLKGIEVTVSSGAATATKVATRSSGRFTVEDRLPAGPYTVRFDDPKHVWASQYLGGGPDKSVRQAVTITPGQPISGLDTALKSESSAKFATKVSGRTAKVAVKIKRTATGSAPGGTFRLSFNGLSTAAAQVKKGKASVTFIGLPKGTLSLVAHYSGTSSTAEFSKVVKVTVK